MLKKSCQGLKVPRGWWLYPWPPEAVGVYGWGLRVSRPFATPLSPNFQSLGFTCYVAPVVL